MSNKKKNVNNKPLFMRILILGLAAIMIIGAVAGAFFSLF